MKVKDLIEQLQELDPIGEIEVSTANGAILLVDRHQGYHDGPNIYFSQSKFYPEKMFVNYKDDKIVIYTVSIEDFIHDHKGDYSKIEIMGADVFCNPESEIKSLQDYLKKCSEEYHETRAKKNEKQI